MTKEMQKMSWMQFRAALDGGVRTVILPIGTVEAHGVTVLGTDNLIPESIAAYLAKQIDALIAPTINYGITKSLYGYPGSVTVTPESFGQYVRDVLDSLADSGFERVIVLNGHGGNDAVLKDVAYSFFYDSGVKIAVVQWWELCEDVTNEVFGETGGHAGIDETAMMQAIDAKLVSKAQFNMDLAYTVNPAAYVYPIPGSILLYKEGEGIPDFDASRAGDFQKKVFEKVSEFVKFVLDRWDLI